jgi:hypothetical protein
LKNACDKDSKSIRNISKKIKMSAQTKSNPKIEIISPENYFFATLFEHEKMKLRFTGILCS